MNLGGGGVAIQLKSDNGSGSLYSDTGYGAGVALKNDKCNNFLFLGDDGKSMLEANKRRRVKHS